MRSIILFAKPPVPGKVKTRLSPPLTAGQAARVYRGMAKDCWAAARKAVGANAVIALDAKKAKPTAAWLAPKAKVLGQEGKDLGARMSAACARAFGWGASRVLILGSDCPEVTAAELKRALGRLSAVDVVLGPSADGGYYLIGLKEPQPALFIGMRWSRPDVLAKTLRRAAARGLSVALLRRRADIDTFADLSALSRRKLPRWTSAALKAMLSMLLLTAPRLGLGAEYVIDRFDGKTGEQGVPFGWKPLLFAKIPRRTFYTLGQDGNDWHVLATSDSAASAIVKEVPIALKDYPFLSWRWRVDRTIGKGDPSKKEGDDYPARLYVAFAYDPGRAKGWEKIKYGLLRRLYGAYPPKAVLNYVWDSRGAKGREFDNPHTERAKMIVLQTGGPGHWLSERRNVYADYKRLFGEEPPRLSFVALMADSDNTKSRCSSAFDDIVFSSP